MAVSVGTIVAYLELQDRLSGQLQAAASKVEAFGQKAQAVGSQLQSWGAQMLPLSVGIGAVGAAGLTMSGRFEKDLGTIVNLVGINSQQVDEWRDSLLEMAPAVGVGPDALAKALFTITSGGIRGAEALQIVENAAKATALGLGDTAEIGRVVTQIMLAYGPASISAKDATELLVTTVREGNLSATDLAGSIGRVIPIAASLGVQFKDVGAFVAAYTRVGGDASEATTALRGMLSILINTTRQGAEALDKIGLSAGGLRNEIKEKGLIPTLLHMVEAFKGNEEALADVVPNVRALTGLLATAGVQGGSFAQILEGVSDHVDVLDKGMVNVRKETSFAFDTMRAKAEALSIKVGDTLKPAFLEFTNTLMGPVKAALFDVIDAFGKWPPEIQRVVIGFGGLLAVGPPALIALGTAIKIAGVGMAGLGATVSGVSASVFALGNTVPVLTARLWLMDVAAKSTWISLGGPIAWVVAGVVALGVAWAKFTGDWTRAFDVLLPPLGVLRAGIDALKRSVETTLPSVETAFKNLADRGIKPAAFGLAFLGKENELFAKTTAASSSSVDMMRDRVQRLLSTALTPLTAVQKTYIAQLQAAGYAEEAIAEAVGASTEAVGKYAAQIKTAAQQNAEFAAAGAKVNREMLDAARKAFPDTREAARKLFAEFEKGTLTIVALKNAIPPSSRHLDELGTAFWDAAAGMAGAKVAGDQAGVTITDGAAKTKTWTERMRGLSQSLSDFAQVAGGTWGRVVSGLGQVVAASDVMRASFDSIKGGMADIAKGGVTNFLGGLSSLGQGFMGLATLAIQAIGAIAKMMDHTLADVKRMAADVTRYGVELSESLAKKIEADAKKIGDEHAALVKNTAAILQEAGGVIAFGWEKAIARVRDIFVMIETGKLSIADATKAFGESFKLLADELVKSNKLASASFLELLALQRRFGVESAEVSAFIAGQLGSAVTGLSALMTGMVTSAAAFETAQVDAAIANTKQLLETATGETRTQLEAQLAEYERQKEGIVGVFLTTQQQASGLAAAVVGAFGEMIAQGRPITEVLKELADPIETLKKQLEATGLSGGAAFEFITTMSGIANDAVAGPLVDAVAGANAALKGLHNSGILNQDMFSGLAMTATDAYQRIIAEGHDGDAALAMMQPTLQTLWELQDKFGYKVDEATQAMIDQGVEAGLVGEQNKSAADKQFDALSRIADKMGELVDYFKRAFPAAAAEGADMVSRALAGIRVPNIRVKVGYEVEDFPGVPRPVPSFRRGSDGFADFGSGTLAMLHGEEAVVPRGQAAEWSDTSGLESKLDELITILPGAVGRAVRNAIALAPGR